MAQSRPRRQTDALTFVPPVPGLVLMPFETAVLGLLLLLTWALPVIYFAVGRRWGAASMASAAMAVVLLSGATACGLGARGGFADQLGAAYVILACGGLALLSILSGVVLGVWARVRGQARVGAAGLALNLLILAGMVAVFFLHDF